MSLFGDDDDTIAPQTRFKSSLFDDEPATPSRKKVSNDNTFSSIFADTDDTPWGSVGKKRTGSVVKSLLEGADVPDLYIDTFDELQRGSGNITAEDAKELLRDSSIDSADQDRIWSIVSSGNSEETSQLGRGEFNVLFALIGLAQEGEDLGLDAVDDRRRKLPVPDLPALDKKKKKTKSMATTAAPSEAPQASSSEAQGGAQAISEQPRAAARKPSFGLESDPWASPELHKGHKHLNGNNGFGAQRTTSSFTTTSTEPANTNGSYEAASTAPSGGWGGSTTTFASGNTAGFGVVDGPTSSAGFGEAGDEPSKPAPQRSQHVRASTGAEESVTVNILTEKEGMFLFQHRNYEVASVRRNSKVIRRYSDFVWLLDCLHKRYPFRQLPLLPPKRVAINGNHLAADTTFLEKRRRGLARFANALVRHPVLRDEQLVVMFLTVPTVDASPLLKL